MSKPPRELTVSEERDYVADGAGPVQDTDVYSKQGSESEPRPAHIGAGPRNMAQSNPDDPLPDLRRQAARKGSSGRSFRFPRWLGLAMGLISAALVAFSLVVFVGVFVGGTSPPTEVAAPPPAPASEQPDPPEKIQGVRVRKGLKRGPEDLNNPNP
ncbi:MAG: hypothetical protein AAGA48_17810 [Myxococcota bacterium]